MSSCPTESSLGVSSDANCRSNSDSFASLQKNIRRASITIDAILKLNPTLSSSGPVVSVDGNENAAPSSEIAKKKAKAKKERRKSLSDMCKVSGPAKPAA